MTIGATTSYLSSNPPTSQQNAFQQNFAALVQALQGGNLSSAQSAYQTLMQNAPANATNASSSSQANPFAQALASIGTALQSGNLSAAQAALQTLQQIMRGHHHRHPPESQTASATPSTTSSNAASTGISTISVTSTTTSINITV